MIGHLVLSVTDFNKSEVFYDELMRQCGRHIRWKEDHDDCEIKSYGVKGYPTALMIRKDKIHPLGSFVRYPGLDHLCLQVKSSGVVDTVYQQLIDQGHETTTIPKKYPKYSDEYYAFSFRDPDGIPLEVAYY